MGALGNPCSVAWRVVGGAYLLTVGMTSMFNGAVPRLEPDAEARSCWPRFSGRRCRWVGVYIPAYLAGKITPLEGMRPVVSETKAHISKSYITASLAFFSVVALILGGSIAGWLPLELLIPTGVVFTAAIVLLVPIVLGPLSRGTAFVLYPLLKTEGQIASRQILRRPRAHHAHHRHFVHRGEHRSEHGNVDHQQRQRREPVVRQGDAG